MGLLSSGLLGSQFVDLVLEYICFLNGLPAEVPKLVGQYQLCEVATAHLAALEQRACESTLVHLDQLDEVFEGQLLSLDDLLVLGLESGELEQFRDRSDPSSRLL